MVHPLDGAFAKLRCAEEHLRCLHKEIDRWEHVVEQSSSGEYNADRTQYRHYWHPDPVPDRDWWATLTGDCLHDLRSALDNTIYALSKPKIRGSEFPIYLRRRDFYRPLRDRTGGLYKISGITNPDVRALIEGAQPWKRRQRPSDHALWLLHDLNRKDKHRLLTPVGIIPTDIDFRHLAIGTLRPHTTAPHLSGRAPVPLQRRALLFTLTSGVPMVEVRMNYQFTMEIALSRRDRVYPLLAALEDVRQTTRRLIEQIRDAVG
jgi:hypothetical protein